MMVLIGSAADAQLKKRLSSQRLWSFIELKVTTKSSIDEINNIRIHAKCCQLAFPSARWRCGWYFLLNTLSNKSDASVNDSDCTVQMLLFISI